MKNIENRETLKKLICIVTISLAVTGILFIPQIMFSRVKLSETQENESIDIAKTDSVSTNNITPLPKTSSRNGEEVRNSANNAEKVTENQDNEETKNEEKEEEKKK